MRDQIYSVVAVNDIKKQPIVPPEYYNLLPTVDDLRAFTATEFATDIETNPATQEIKMVGLSARPFHAIVVPFTGPYIVELKRIFANAKRVIGHNVEAFDKVILANNGVRVSAECDIFDTMLAQHLLFPDLPHDLEFLASQFTNKPAWKGLDRESPTYWQIRCARDVDATLQIARVIAPMLKLEDLDSLYRYCQIPLARICKLMHDTGIKRDPARLKQVREKLLDEIKTTEAQLPVELQTHTVPTRKRVKAPAGTLGKGGKPVKYVFEESSKEVVPWRSDDVLKEYLYGTLNLPVQLQVKTKKPTVDKTALEKLERRCRKEGKFAEAKVIASLRELSKASTLVSSFCQEQVEGVSRVHANFLVHGTASGRLSSSSPNMQNQPETARYIYVPSHADWCWVQADYSSGENRLTAFFANDTERMARLSQPGFNEHKWTASQMFGIPIAEVKKDNSKDAPYGAAKRVGHGLNYLMGVQKICNLYDMDYATVRELVSKWKTLNSKTCEWQERVVRQAEQDGVLRTPFGRKRWFYWAGLATDAASFTPQSTLADVIYRAMIGLMYERIDWPLDRVLQVVRVARPLPWPAQLVLQVHDSLLVECPRALVDQVADTMKYVMEQPFSELGGMSIPTEIEVSEPGASWGEVQKYTPLQLAA